MHNHLRQMAEARFGESVTLTHQFFTEQAPLISQACLEMARRFQDGGRLLAFGAGNAVTDALHVSVEFVHPVIVGKRALPAIALGSDMAATLGGALARGWEMVYAQQLVTIGRAPDIALGIEMVGGDSAVRRGLEAAAAQGLLTILLSGPPTETAASFDFAFHVPSQDQALVQETHETLYHVLWELVHVFFENPLPQDDA